ncbi:Trypsin [Allochromatium warmingii]|uniref:Trypsin n=1 Tax=Allochromatium warmingii TaxID=61595 RepID=A0A1H3ALZ7_ALLWA|nr:trypsin-like serine protease [Allochromatium warmingii]SDX30408.1 Trypsin [Allochromatium warmingii]
MLTTQHYSDSRYQTTPGTGYDGVVRVQVGSYYGSGSLLFDGRAVLTAAHLFSHGHTNTSVTFETTAGSQTVTATQVVIHPKHNRIDISNDLALVWLSETAPVAANRYNLYRDTNELDQTMTMVGYGMTGSGTIGTDAYSSEPPRLRAYNQFDADGAVLKQALGTSMTWSPPAGTQLIADFDDGSAAHDALGDILNAWDTGLGDYEGLIGVGDSGGPALIAGQVAGVASYTARLTSETGSADIDAIANNSFGEVGAWTRVSAYQQWIDQQLRAQYPDAPTTPAEVERSITEGHTGTEYVYFLLQFTGIRTNPEQILSVDYVTRDGTAVAYSDYLPVSGQLNLYPGENQAVIPVEIIGDTVPELDEVFYLDVFNPVGGHFGNGVVQLTAMRTILNDDGVFI